MGVEAPLRHVAEATALILIVSSFVRPVEAWLATTCYVEFDSNILTGPLDFACGVVNDTSVGFLLSRDFFFQRGLIVS
jgi:hypothetical protein